MSLHALSQISKQGLSLVKKISLRNTSVQLILLLAAVFLLGDQLPLQTKTGFYTLSVFLKEGLLLVLPVIIFTCLFNTLLANKAYAFRFILILSLMVIVSNFMSTFVGYFTSQIALPHLNLSSVNTELTANTPLNDLTALWPIVIDPWQMKAWFTNQGALLLGLVFGLLCSVFSSPRIEKTAERLQSWVNFFLTKLFIPILPLFVLGFILKIQHEGKFSVIFTTYAPIFALIMLTNVLYILVLYFLAAKLNIKKMMQAIKNMLPAGLAGFTTMSSMATLPFTIKAAERNVSAHNQATVRAVIPATVNIHLIGDSIAITTMALGMLLAFGYAFPPFAQFWEFAQFFVLAKFSVATIPGGSIIAMLPVLEKTLGFSGEMLGFIMAVYVLFDPMITAMNVVGNGAFAMLFTRAMPGKQEVTGPVVEHLSR